MEVIDILEREKERERSLSRVAELVRASSCYVKAVGLIPGQGTYKNQPINASVSLSLSLSLSLINK